MTKKIQFVVSALPIGFHFASHSDSKCMQKFLNF